MADNNEEKWLFEPTWVETILILILIITVIVVGWRVFRPTISVNDIYSYPIKISPQTVDLGCVKRHNCSDCLEDYRGNGCSSCIKMCRLPEEEIDCKSIFTSGSAAECMESGDLWLQEICCGGN